MNRYIDVEKLKSKIDSFMDDLWKVLPDVSNVENGELSIREASDLGAYKALEIVLGYIESLQQEQPEVDLEKFTEKIKTFQGKYKHPEIVSIKGAMAFMARMFYQYPNVARQWYDSLPKATMDDTRKEE